MTNEEQIKIYEKRKAQLEIDHKAYQIRANCAKKDIEFLENKIKELSEDVYTS